MTAVEVEESRHGPSFSLGEWDQLLDGLDTDSTRWGAPSRGIARESLLVDVQLGQVLADVSEQDRREAARAFFWDAAVRYNVRSTLNPATGDVGIYKGEAIAFAEGAWAAYSRAWVESLSRSADQPRHMRLLFAAMARVQPRSGLAYFHEGELRDVLGQPGTPCTRQRVTDALARARDLGLILPESDVHHVWLDRQHVQRGK